MNAGINMNQYKCLECQTTFDPNPNEPWHPECTKCFSSNTREILECDLCHSKFLFGPEGLVTNPAYTGISGASGERGVHELLLDGILYTIKLHQWNTCYNCCRKLIADGHAKIIPPKTCSNCKKSCVDEHGWDGSDVEADLTCSGGYGSVSFDMQCRQFQLAPGWYCYPCLDMEVNTGKTVLLRGRE